MSNRKRAIIAVRILCFIVVCANQAVAKPVKVYLLGGQSNMVGTGTSEFVPAEMVAPRMDVRIYAAGQVEPTLANRWLDLQPGFGYDVLHHGPELSFGHSMANAMPGTEIALIKYSWGGTNLAGDWRPPDTNGNGAGPHYLAFIQTAANALADLTAAGKEYDIAGMVWMQGELDAESPVNSELYKSNLPAFIASVRAYFNVPEMPFVIGQIHRNIWVYGPAVRQAQLDVARMMHNVQTVITSDLDCFVHYTKDGFIQLGLRFADQMLWMNQAVNLAGPADDSTAGAGAVTLGCQPVYGAVSYQLLIGPDPMHLDFLIAQSATPPSSILRELPFESIYWTVRVRNGFVPFGSVTQARPMHFIPPLVTPPVRNLTSGKVYNYIQPAIYDATDGDVIEARPWRYAGSINFGTRKVILRSIAPEDPQVVASTIIDGDNRRPAVLLGNEWLGQPITGFAVNFGSGQDANCVLDGFTITYQSDIYNVNGIYCADGANPVIADCVVRNCEGKGLHASMGSPFVFGCAFVNNGASGAVFDWCRADIFVANCIFAGNAGEGLRLYRPRRPAKILSTIASGNDGNGVDVQVCSNLTVSNCDILGNFGAGLHTYSTKMLITNSIIRENMAAQIAGNSLEPPNTTVDYSNIEGGWPLGEGNIDVDPCFVSGGWWDENGTADDASDDYWREGNYHLRPASVCIDAGDPNYVPGADETDLDGAPRVIGERIDMGGYEFNPPVEASICIVPSVLNLASHGRWILVIIQLPNPYDIRQIVRDSVMMQGQIAAYGVFVYQQHHRAIAVFEWSKVQKIVHMGIAKLSVSGELADGTVFEGSDTIRVIGPRRK